MDVVGRRVEDVRRSGATALMNHIAQHPRDVLAVSAAVPTIAFSGVTDLQQEAWELVEGLAPAYGDHWWYISLLAFTRQDQSRFDDAGLLAESALSCEPTSGHAVHAQTHVLYETGKHDTGRAWLDHWVAESGRAASHRAHFSWHAALHELALGDTEAVRQRYYTQLAPPTVTGVRALIDSASLLWRWRVTTSGWDAAAGTSAFAGRGGPAPGRLRARGGRGRPRGPARRRRSWRCTRPWRSRPPATCRGSPHSARTARPPVTSPIRTTVVTVCDALLAAGEQDWSAAVAPARGRAARVCRAWAGPRPSARSSRRRCCSAWSATAGPSARWPCSTTGWTGVPLPLDGRRRASLATRGGTRVPVG